MSALLYERNEGETLFEVFFIIVFFCFFLFFECYFFDAFLNYNYDNSYNCCTGSNCQSRKIIDEQRYFYFTTLIVTRKDVNEYMKHHPEYTKANRFKDIVCKIYI